MSLQFRSHDIDQSHIDFNRRIWPEPSDDQQHLLSASCFFFLFKLIEKKSQSKYWFGDRPSLWRPRFVTINWNRLKSTHFFLVNFHSKISYFISLDFSFSSKIILLLIVHGNYSPYFFFSSMSNIWKNKSRKDVNDNE